MAIQSQYKYIGYSTLIISISLLLGWFASRPDFFVQLPPNITCMGDCMNPSDSDCIGYFNITSLSKRFYIRNKGDMNLPFTEPEKVKSFQVYRADLRFRTDNPNRWKPINLSKGMTFQVNQTNEFRLNLCKNSPSDDIKWGLSGIVEADPVFFGINIEKLEDCKTTSQFEKRVQNTQYIYYQNQTQCSDEPANLSCKIVNYRNQTSSYSVGYVDIMNITVCRNTGFNVNGRLLDFAEKDWLCTKYTDELCCEAPHQSNKNGNCDSGEGYCIFEIPSMKESCTVSKTNAIRNLAIT